MGLELGDHVATFGGGVNPATDEPEDGVIGVYTLSTFPQVRRSGKKPLENRSGWASWSGTSFATAIASGLVCSYWSAERAKRPDVSAEDVLLEFHKLAREFAPAVRTPSIPVTGEWLSSE